MSALSLRRPAQAGFTLIELMVVMIVMAVFMLSFIVFFKSALFNYLNLQADSTEFTTLESQAVRVATVLRTTTGISSASANDFSGYAYFYPTDSYVSLIHYYLKTTDGVTQLDADVTPMTANPPTGTPITASEKTYTIIDNYYQKSSINLFNYLSASGTSLSLPISDLSTIKGIAVNLAVRTQTTGSNNQAITVQVTLRNRKANL